MAKTHADPAELSQFQIKLLTKLLTKFPSALLVSYSTCSIHSVENEDVVAAVMEDETGISKEWELWNALPEWPLRGKSHTLVVCGQTSDRRLTGSLLRFSSESLYSKGPHDHLSTSSIKDCSSRVREEA